MKGCIVLFFGIVIGFSGIKLHKIEREKFSYWENINRKYTEKVANKDILICRKAFVERNLNKRCIVCGEKVSFELTTTDPGIIYQSTCYLCNDHKKLGELIKSKNSSEAELYLESFYQGPGRYDKSQIGLDFHTKEITYWHPDYPKDSLMFMRIGSFFALIFAFFLILIGLLFIIFPIFMRSSELLPKFFIK